MLGLIVRADNTGLGIQTYGFYKYLKPEKVMVVDISDLNGNKQFYERYPNAQIVKGIPKANDLREFLDGLKSVLTVEIPYNYYLFELAERMNIKTYLQYNYEFLDYLNNEELPKPSLFIAPSEWHYTDVLMKGFNAQLLHYPVDTEVLKPRKIKEAKRFVHIIGKPAIHDRNGTDIVIESLKYIESDITVVFKCQKNEYIEDIKKKIKDSKVRIEFEGEVEHYEDNYKDGDVLILPRKFGGLCLPMQEALAVGMPVIMTDISPNNQRLPLDWLIPAKKVGEFMTRTLIDIYEANPKDLAKKIDWFANEDLAVHNKRALEFGVLFSWDNLRGIYNAILRDYEN